MHVSLAKFSSILTIVLLASILSSQGQSEQTSSKVFAPYSAFVPGIKCRDSVSVSFLKTAFQLKCENDDLKVIGFRFGYAGDCFKYGFYGEIECLGDTLSEKAIQVLNYRASPGMPLYFDAIRVVDSKGSVYYLKNLWYYVKAEPAFQ